MSYNDSSYGLFQGSFYLQERSLNGANLTGYQFVGDVDKFMITPKQKFEDIEESMTGLGLTSAHILTGTTVEASFTALDIKFANWVRATWGGGGTSVTGSTVSGEAVTFYNGQTTKLARPGVSSVVITSTPTLTVTTDYVVDTVNGAISIPTTSSNVAAGSPVTGTIAYTYATYGGTVQAFVTGQRYYRALLLGRNVAQGNQPVQIVVNQITFDIAKTFSLIDKKHMNFEMSGMCLQDTLIATPAASTDLSQFFSATKA